MLKFKKGYALVVTTSENDYDNLAESVTDGLSKEEATALKLFLTAAKPLGNTFDWSTGITLDPNTAEVLARYWNLTIEDLQSPDFLQDTLSELVGVWDAGQQLRCVEEIQCIFFNENVYEVTI